MEQPKIIISSCGTSVLTNQTNNELRGLINQLANAKESYLSEDQKNRLDTHVKERQILIEKIQNPNEAKKLSAELNGIITYYNGNLGLKEGTPDQHFLVVSDTYLGKSVGNIIRSWLESHGFTVQVISPEGFVTDNQDNFRDAMTWLIKWCQETLTGYQKSGYRIVFNLTGGFKSAQGFLQTIGMFYADEIIYIFETGTLLTIPRLPIELDTKGTVGQHFNAFRQLGQKQDLSMEICQGIPETLLLQIDNKVCLSEWGELIWQKAKFGYYSEKLVEPFSKNIIYTEQFRRSVRKLQLSPDRYEVLNQRLDQLNVVIQKKASNSRGLDFKALVSNPLPPATHECDIWSDWEHRLFGHYIFDRQFQIDDIRRGLHH